MDLNEGLPKMIDEWTPLEYIRHFALHRKKITTDPRYIYFGRVKFFKTTKTNFQAEYGDRDDDDDVHRPAHIGVGLPRLADPLAAREAVAPHHVGDDAHRDKRRVLAQAHGADRHI